MPTKQKLLALIILIVGVYFINSISRQVYRLYKTRDLITNAQTKLEKLQTEQQELIKTLDYQKSDEFIEKEARNKLGLVKPGESIVVLPKDNNESGLKPSGQASNFRLWWQAVFE